MPTVQSSRSKRKPELSKAPKSISKKLGATAILNGKKENVAERILSMIGRKVVDVAGEAVGMNHRILTIMLFILISISQVALAEEEHSHHDHHDHTSSEHPQTEQSGHEEEGGVTFIGRNPISISAGDCSEMEVWDAGMGMCMPLPMAGMPMSMVMVHGNAFGTYVTESGQRGRNAFAGPNMVMLDVGRTFGDHHYLNLGFMGTTELWTFPAAGYPELLQIGEDQSNGQPFLDAQHPHSSPVMGLTLSDTIKLGSGEKDHLKLFFAPRGESTDGPIAFMHRPTGMVNPDAPLGHHIGQDVGHISSTVIGASLKLGNTRIEASTFHGAEPQPTKVDLPIGTPDSGAVRLIEEFSPTFTAMGSFAYVYAPEPNDPDISFLLRFSASAYNQVKLSNDWKFYNTLIYGGTTRYDHATLLNSFTEEFWFSRGAPNIWGRFEVLQRTPAELQIPGPSGQNSGRWVSALTLGYTHNVFPLTGLQVGVGGSVTKDVLPNDFLAAYGGNPWSGKVFVQVSGMGMWHW